MFLETKDQSPEKVDDNNWLQDLAFKVDITGHLNDLNSKLKGKQQVITSLSDVINAFKTNLRLSEGQLNSGNLTHFPMYQDYRNSDFSRYISNIKNLLPDFHNRFEDFKSHEDDFPLFMLHSPLLFRRQIVIFKWNLLKFSEILC